MHKKRKTDDKSIQTVSRLYYFLSIFFCYTTINTMSESRKARAIFREMRTKNNFFTPFVSFFLLQCLGQYSFWYYGNK